MSHSKFNIPADLSKKLEDFCKKVDAYKAQFAEEYDKSMQVPVFQKRNSQFDREVIASTAFFGFCHDILKKSNSPAAQKENSAQKLNQSIATLRHDISLYLNAPNVKDSDKKACENLVKELDDVATSLKTEYPALKKLS